MNETPDRPEELRPVLFAWDFKPASADVHMAALARAVAAVADGAYLILDAAIVSAVGLLAPGQLPPNRGPRAGLIRAPRGKRGIPETRMAIAVALGESLVGRMEVELPAQDEADAVWGDGFSKLRTVGDFVQALRPMDPSIDDELAG